MLFMSRTFSVSRTVSSLGVAHTMRWMRSRSGFSDAVLCW